MFHISFWLPIFENKKKNFRKKPEFGSHWVLGREWGWGGEKNPYLGSVYGVGKKLSGNNNKKKMVKIFLYSMFICVFDIWKKKNERKKILKNFQRILAVLCFVIGIFLYYQMSKTKTKEFSFFWNKTYFSISILFHFFWSKCLSFRKKLLLWEETVEFIYIIYLDDIMDFNFIFLKIKFFFFTKLGCCCCCFWNCSKKRIFCFSMKPNKITTINPNFRKINLKLSWKDHDLNIKILDCQLPIFVSF